MNFYVSITLLMLFVLLFRLKDKRYSYCLLAIFFFLAAFRGENVGTDTKSYLDYSNMVNRAANANFEDFKILDLGSRVEVINNYVCKFILQMRLHPRFLLIFYDVVMLGFLASACRRFRVNVTYTLVFYILFGYYFVSLNIARQLCAASVVLYSLSFLNEVGRKKLLFFFWLLVAVGIHSLSILCVIFFVVTLFPRIKVKCAYYILALSLMLIFVRVNFIEQIMSVVESSHINFYMNTFGEARATNTVGIISCLLEVICFYYFLFMTKNIEKNNYLNLYDYIFLLSVFLYAAFFNYSGIVSRMRFTTCIFICVYLAAYFVRRPLKLNSRDAVIFFVLYLVNFIKRYQYSLGDDVAYYLAL